jgi:hypothetical protein
MSRYCIFTGSRMLKQRRADRWCRARATVRCSLQLWSSQAIQERSLQRDLTPLANSLPQAQWTGLYVSQKCAILKRHWLISSSTLAQFWNMRELRYFDWTQTSSVRSALVTRLESSLFRIGRHAPGKLGRRDWRANTQASWTRGGDQLYGRQQAW